MLHFARRATSLHRYFSSRSALVSSATRNVNHILSNCVKHTPEHRLIVLYFPNFFKVLTSRFDTRCELSQILTEAYKQVPNAEPINFDETNNETIIELFSMLAPKDLVVMIQSSAFMLEAYRIRLRLFEKGIKNIEHVHLENLYENQHEAYINALAFDHTGEDGQLARRLKAKVDSSKHTVVECFGGSKLVYETGMEPAKLNLGDYEGMQNIGGTFPVGEVFSEPKILEKVNGTCTVWGFPNLSRLVEVGEPFPLTIKNGRLTDYSGAPASFRELAEGIMGGEGDLVIREFGLGLNKGMSKRKPVNDITAFERNIGLHISLGMKHTIFAKEGISKRKTRFHIDMFLDIEKITMDDTLIWNETDYVRESKDF